MITRIKLRQRKILHTHWRQIFVANVLYMTPLLLIGLLLFARLITRLIDFLPLAQRSFIRIELLMPLIGQALCAALLFLAVRIILGGPLTLGLQNYFIRLSRGQHPTPTTVLLPFHKLQSCSFGIKIKCALYAHSMQWLLPYLLIGSVLSILLKLWFLLALGVILLLVRILYYQACYTVFQTDTPVWEASIKRSAVFHGNYLTLLRLVLRFSPWLILRILVQGGLLILPFLPAAAGFTFALTIICGIFYVAAEFTLGAYVKAYFWLCFYDLFDALTPVPQQSFAQALTDIQAQPIIWEQEK